MKLHSDRLVEQSVFHSSFTMMSPLRPHLVGRFYCVWFNVCSIIANLSEAVQPDVLGEIKIEQVVVITRNL